MTVFLLLRESLVDTELTVVSQHILGLVIFTAIELYYRHTPSSPPLELLVATLDMASSNIHSLRM
jgi:hypothetical protein